MVAVWNNRARARLARTIRGALPPRIAVGSLHEATDFCLQSWELKAGERRVERALEKLARQLLSFDEASLMALWEKYYERVQHFEPTRTWEEAVLVLNLIQAVHWKNLLFNTKWAEETSLQPDPAPPGDRPGTDMETSGSKEQAVNQKQPEDKGRVIRFPHPNGDGNEE